MSETDDAKRLADWLDQPPGTTPPPDLDPEVLAAVLVLRPDRAPAPRLDLEELLAAPSPDNVVALPAPPARAAPLPARRGRPTWWVMPLVGGAFAAAAAVTLVVLPLIQQPGLPPVADRLARSTEPASGPPAASTPIAEATPDPGALGTTAPQAAPVLAEGGAAPDASTSDGAPPPEAVTGRAPARPASSAPVEELAERSAGDPGALAGPTADGLGASPPAATPSPASKSTIAEVDEQERRLDDWSTPPELATAMAKRESSSASSRSAAKDDEVSLADEDEEVALREESRPARTKSRETEAHQQAAPSAAPGMAQAEPAPPSPPLAGTAARNRAVPLDYDPGWYRRHPDAVPDFELATLKEKAGDWSAAERIYARYYADPRADLAQDAAWRGARTLQARALPVEALAVVDLGLTRSSTNTVQRARLLLLRGDLLAQLGRATEANADWAEAARLNTQR